MSIFTDDYENKVQGYSHSRYTSEQFLQAKDESTREIFGLELEFSGDENDSDSTMFSDIQNLMGSTGVMKTDSSINGDYAFELVTKPFSMKYFESDFFNLKKVLSIINQEGYTTDSSCGMHVHISRRMFNDHRNGLSNLPECKLLLILAKNQKLLKDLSGRDTFHYCNFDFSDFVIDDVEILKKAQNINQMRSIIAGERYEALNLGNSSTLEFRFFGGTTDYDTIEMRLNIIRAICCYADSHSSDACYTTALPEILFWAKYSVPNFDPRNLTAELSAKGEE